MSKADRSALTAQAMLRNLRNNQPTPHAQPLPQSKKGIWSNLPTHYIVINEAPSKKDS